MAFIRAFGGGGIPSALKSAMNAVLNKKFGTSTTYAPEDWPEDVNLLGPLPEKAVSGSIAHVEDGADTVPIKSWDVTVDANLDGVSSIKVTQAGKNLADFSTFVDGYVNTNGTFNSNHTNGEMRSDFIPVKPNTQYYFSIIDTTGTAADWVGIGEYTTNSTSGFIRRDSFWRFTTSPTTKYIVISSRNLAQATKIQLEVSYDPTSYEPYIAPTVTTVSLGRTIYGGKADVANGTGTDGFIKYELDENDSWSPYSGAGHSFWHNVATGEDRPIDQTKLSECICNHLTYSSSAPASAPDFSFVVQGGQRIVVTADSTIDTVDKFKTWLQSNPLVFACPAASPTDFTFDPITPTPETALGVNNFWADEGDSEITYRADIGLALAANSSRGLMMASRPVTQLIGEESDLNQVNELVEDDENNETEQEGEDDENIRQDPADR